MSVKLEKYVQRLVWELEPGLDLLVGRSRAATIRFRFQKGKYKAYFEKTLNSLGDDPSSPLNVWRDVGAEGVPVPQEILRELCSILQKHLDEHEPPRKPAVPLN